MNIDTKKRSETNLQRTYCINDLIDVLRVGRTMIYQLIKEGRLKIVKIGDRTLVTAEDLDSFIASLRSA